jgi:Ribbon-helix-helix protein, copG family
MPDPVVAIRVPKDLRDRIEAEAARLGVDRSALLRDVLNERFPVEQARRQAESLTDLFARTTRG